MKKNEKKATDNEDIIKKVPLDGPISQLLEKFVETHFRPEEFIKRKRILQTFSISLGI